jgi:hypothetical protein
MRSIVIYIFTFSIPFKLVCEVKRYRLGLIIIFRRYIIFGTRKRRGEIYLNDSDTLYMSQNQYRDAESDSETEVEGEAFSYN